MAFTKMSNFFILIVIASLCEGKIDRALLKSLGKMGRADVLVNFYGDNSAVIKDIQSKSFLDRLTKISSLNSGLHKLTDKTQGPVKSYLDATGARSQSFWSSNQMVIRNVNLLLVHGVDAFPQVRRIQKLPVINLIPIKASKPKADETNSTVQWGIAKIQADQVWSNYNINGEGVVVSNIDTGVLGTHEALAGNFRSDHGWYDPYDNSTTPGDGNGHGTHTMGTICGAGGIGVAPGAKWIACRGCGSSSCDAGQLLACGQWILSPTNPDGTDPQPSLVPDVVSNSWGSNIGGDDWYNATIEAWKAAGIMHAFAIGNSGPACRSAGSPGDQPSTFSVGSTDRNDRLSIFSSKGPAGSYPSNYIKPDIAAPGSNVYSAWNTNDTAYNTISGTSMATPHVAGTLALMLSALRTQNGDTASKMDFDMAVANIENTADRNLTVSFPNYRCDGYFSNSRVYPNNQFGYGRINALNAVGATMNVTS